MSLSQSGIAAAQPATGRSKGKAVGRDQTEDVPDFDQVRRSIPNHDPALGFVPGPFEVIRSDGAHPMRGISLASSNTNSIEWSRLDVEQRSVHSFARTTLVIGGYHEAMISIRDELCRQSAKAWNLQPL